jgi:hypothetical protein
MQVQIDPRVELVIEFMSRNLPADLLVRIARTVADLAPIVWPDEVILHTEPFEPVTWLWTPGSVIPGHGNGFEAERQETPSQ